MKKLIGFIKRHRWFTIYVTPVILMLLMAVLSALRIRFLLDIGDRPGGISESFFDLFLILLLFFSLVYPFIFTVTNLYFICKKNPSPFENKVNNLTEGATILAGTILSYIYIPEAANISFSDWDQVLYNSQVHTPIATWALPAVVTFSGAGVLGYLILRIVPLKKMPPLVAVLSISAMYIGCIMCVLWTVQTFQPNRGGVYLYLFPINCILIAVKVIRRTIWQWQELYPAPGQEPAEDTLGKMKGLLRNCANWPWLAFLFMVPLLGILLLVLILFGQEPDSIIKAWTETSQWTLSQRVSPPNLTYDEHYLCTAAAGGHPGIVKPIRRGVRHGHEVTVNRQLCVANAFEQILEERLPGLHRFVRNAYDRYGYPLARHVSSPLAADVVYIAMKPLEWFFLTVIYLCDPKPENRIAMQYITPIGQEAAWTDSGRRG